MNINNMLNKNAKLNSKIFDNNIVQMLIRKGLIENTWSFSKPEAEVPRCGSGIFQQKNIRDSGTKTLALITC